MGRSCRKAKIAAAQGGWSGVSYIYAPSWDGPYLPLSWYKQLHRPDSQCFRNSDLAWSQRPGNAGFLPHIPFRSDSTAQFSISWKKKRNFPDTPPVSDFLETSCIFSKHPKIILTSSPLEQPQKKIRTHLDSSGRPTYVDIFAIRSVVPSTKVELRHLDFANKTQAWQLLTGGISCCFLQNAIFFRILTQVWD